MPLLVFRIGSKFRCIRSTPTETQSISGNDFECLAGTRVNAPKAMFQRFSPLVCDSNAPPAQNPLDTVVYICRIRVVRLTTPTLLVLAALLQTADEWRYGYDLSRETKLKSGSLYPILIRLKECGWMQSRWQHAENQKPRHLYRLTALGQRLARQALNTPVALARLNPVTERQ